MSKTEKQCNTHLTARPSEAIWAEAVVSGVEVVTCRPIEAGVRITGVPMVLAVAASIAWGTLALVAVDLVMAGAPMKTRTVKK